MTTLQISPSILQWAAHQRGLSVDALVNLLGTSSKPDALLSGKLTLSQIETLAQKTHIPFGYFFLDTPPQSNRSNLPDLRQVQNPEPLSVNFYDTLDDILRKQHWYLDYLHEQGAEKLEFVGKFKADSGLRVERVADDIRNTLGLSIQEQKKCANVAEFFTLLSAKAEAIGILVFRNSIVKSNTRRSLSVNEFRGFAIANSLAPVIFVNGKDSEAAWIFTLAHELAHIWLGESGVSNIPDRQKIVSHPLERLCNQIAAELLLPENLFLNAWDKLPEPKFAALGQEFKVSQLVIARRAYEFQKITWDDYVNAVESSKTDSPKKGAPSPYLIYPIRNSKRVTQAIVTAAMSGKMMLREAASLLNVRPDTIMKMGRRSVEE